jgi:ketosteroid isomerase-like protein
MSQENVELVRRSIEAYLRGDYVGATARFAPDVVWENGQELPAHGPAAVRAMWSRWKSEWEDLEMVAEEFIDVGDKVFVAMHYRGHGRLSGVGVEGWVFEVHTFRDGQCVRKVDFRKRSEALAAVGLRQ